MKRGKGLRFRTKLILWYLAAFVTFFTLLEVYNYYELGAVILDNIDASLAAEAGRVAEDIDVGGGDPFARSNDGAVRSSSAAAAAYSFRVVDAAGSILGVQGGFPKTPRDRPTAGFATIAASEGRFRIVTKEIPGAGAPGRYYLQAAHSLSELDEELAAALRRFAISLPLVLLLAAAGGLFLASTALKPVARLARLAESIRGDRLGERSGYGGPDDEIGRLARSFDDMLGRLEAAFERERRFAADASHELRTPLTALKGSVEVALARPRSAPEYAEVLASIRGEIDRLVALSADLLLLARLGSAAIARESEHVDLGTLLAFCVEGVTEGAAARNLGLHAARIGGEPESGPGGETGGCGPIVDGSRDSLARLFMNLLENAVKYADEGGSVAISLDRDAGHAIVRIANTGPGISATDLAHVFEPFFRGDAARSRRTGGSGLGLAIAREIAVAHGGDLRLESAPGRETMATVVLPLAAPATR